MSAAVASSVRRVPPGRPTGVPAHNSPRAPLSQRCKGLLTCTELNGRRGCARARAVIAKHARAFACACVLPVPRCITARRVPSLQTAAGGGWWRAQAVVLGTGALGEAPPPASVTARHASGRREETPALYTSTKSLFVYIFVLTTSQTLSRFHAVNCVSSGPVLSPDFPPILSISHQRPVPLSPAGLTVAPARPPPVPSSAGDGRACGGGPGRAASRGDARLPRREWSPDTPRRL